MATCRHPLRHHACVEILRTPDGRFDGLPGWTFEPRYVETSGLRIHYVDEGPPDAAPVLLLHGEPTWGYLYRKMIPPLAAAGHRVIVPDLVGFGRSDKPARRSDYTYARHVAWMSELLRALDLSGVTLFGQDWGGLIGLRLAAEHEDRFDRIVAANTFLPTGDQRTPPAFHLWRLFSQRVPRMPIGWIVRAGCVRGLSSAERAAYDAPFPEERYKAGARQFPALVPTRPDDPESEPNRRAWRVLERWRKPFLTAFSDGDPITRGADRAMRRRIPGTEGLVHPTVRRAGHFLQEDAGDELAGIVDRFVRAR